MGDKLAILGKSEGFIIVFAAVAIASTALLLFGRIDQTVWSSVLQWTFASVCGGGAASAYRDRA